MTMPETYCPCHFAEDGDNRELHDKLLAIETLPGAEVLEIVNSFVRQANLERAEGEMHVADLQCFLDQHTLYPWGDRELVRTVFSEIAFLVCAEIQRSQALCAELLGR